MKKFVLAGIAAVLAIGSFAMASPAEAQYRYGHGHGGFGPGLATGLLLGGVTGYAIGATQPRYYGPPRQVIYQQAPVYYQNPPVVYEYPYQPQPVQVSDGTWFDRDTGHYCRNQQVVNPQNGYQYTGKFCNVGQGRWVQFR